MYYLHISWKRGGDESPEHHLSGWKPDAASLPIELPLPTPLSNHVCPRSSSALPGLSLWLLSALAASASWLRFVDASVF